ncbi:TPA: glycosyltransferase [Candidatus Woesearchaeota archaeon]|nr:glycosyltransferase [Candidatus Woesearchaeota archaeon]
MKVGMVSKYPPEENGVGIYSARLCEELAEIGIGTVRIGDSESATADYRVDLKSLALKWRLKGIVEKEGIDLLHIQHIASHYSKLALNANLLIAMRQKVPVIATLHEVHTTTHTLRDRALSWIEGMIARKASAIIAHTKQQKEHMQHRHGKKESFLAYMGTEQADVHKLKGRNILLFGMLNYGKGAEYLIRAMNELPGYKLIVAGKAVSRGYEKLLREEAAENKQGNVMLDIRWIPEDAKEKYLEEADIMAFPYVWAPYQSAAMHNAISRGIPLVATDAGAIDEVVKGYICGRVVEQRSPKALAAGIKAVYGNYETYQHGALKYRKEAAWARTAERHAQIYNETLQEHYAKHGLPERRRADKEIAEAAKDEAEMFNM